MSTGVDFSVTGFPSRSTTTSTSVPGCVVPEIFAKASPNARPASMFPLTTSFVGGTSWPANLSITSPTFSPDFSAGDPFVIFVTTTPVSPLTPKRAFCFALSSGTGVGVNPRNPRSAAAVAVSVTGLPSRCTTISTFDPTVVAAVSFATASANASTVAGLLASTSFADGRSCPAIFRRTSPILRPARSAGPPGCTLTATTPASAAMPSCMRNCSGITEAGTAWKPSVACGAAERGSGSRRRGRRLRVVRRGPNGLRRGTRAGTLRRGRRASERGAWGAPGDCGEAFTVPRMARGRDSGPGRTPRSAQACAREFRGRSRSDLRATRRSLSDPPLRPCPCSTPRLRNPPAAPPARSSSATASRGSSRTPCRPTYAVVTSLPDASEMRVARLRRVARAGSSTPPRSSARRWPRSPSPSSSRPT